MGSKTRLLLAGVYRFLPAVSLLYRHDHRHFGCACADGADGGHGPIAVTGVDSRQERASHWSMEPTVSAGGFAMRTRNRLLLAGVLVGLAFALGNFGCGGGQASTVSLPITVTISPASATVDSTGTQQFTAAISNDPTNKGVTWSISPASGAGTLSKMTNTSATYTAPTSPASTLNVTITATAVADTTKSAFATIAVA